MKEKLNDFIRGFDEICDSVNKYTTLYADIAEEIRRGNLNPDSSEILTACIILSR